MSKRIFYAIKQVGYAPLGSNSFIAAHGVQSMGMNTTFNLEQVFEYGQIELYENIENLPSIECTMQKVLDGYPLLYHLATRGASAGTLAGRGTVQSQVALTLFDDTQSAASGGSIPIAQVTMSGMYPSAFTYTFPVEGNCTEDLTLIGLEKVWKTSAPFTFSGVFTNTDTPLALASGWGGVQRRENVSFAYSTDSVDANGQVNETTYGGGTVLPREIPGISSSGTNNLLTSSEYSCSIQSITVKVDLGRTDILELGHKAPYHRYVNFPVAVNTDIVINAKTGDLINAGENTSLSNQSIRISTQDYTFIDLGTNNKLTSVQYGGGDSSGGTDSITFSYQNFNSCLVKQRMDPSGL